MDIVSPQSKRLHLPPGVRTAAGIFKEYGGFIRSVIAARAKDKGQVDDLYQAFFLSLVLRPVPETVGNIKGYLYRAIVRDIIDETRKAEKQRKHEHDYGRQCRQTGNAERPEEILMNAERQERFFALVERMLPHRQATSILLRYKHSLSIRETAREMGVDDRSISRYVCTGLRRIRQILNNNDGELDVMR